MRSIHARTRLLAIGAITVGMVAGSALIAGSRDAKPTTVTPDRPGVDPLASSRAMVVPTAIAAPAWCPNDWVGFRNPIVGYDTCYPRGWGFTDLRSPGPLATLRGTSLGAVRLLSADAFPWTRGQIPEEVVAARGIIEVEVASVARYMPDTANDRDCTPSARTTAIGGAAVCEQRIGLASGIPDPNGELVEVLGVIRLPSGDVVVRAHARASVSDDVLETLRQMIAAIRPIEATS